MSDPQGTGGTPGDGGTPSQPAAGTTTGDSGAGTPAKTSQGGTQSEGQSDGQNRPTDDYAELRKSIEAERAENKQLKAQLKQITEKDLPEAERDKRRIAELEQQVADFQTAQRNERINNAIVSAAAKLGFVDPEDAVGLIDRDAIAFAEDGRPRNIEGLVSSLLRQKPHLGGRPRQGGAWGGADGGTNQTGSDMNSILRQASGRGV